MNEMIMKNTYQYPILIFFFLCFAAAGICSDNVTKNIEINGILKNKEPIFGKSGPFSYNLIVETIPYKGDKKKEQELIGWDYGPEIIIIKTIKFKLSDFLFDFPKDSFNDLCRVDVRADEYSPVIIKDGNIILTLSGGEASSYYKVRYFLRINKKSLKLTKREVSIYPPWDFKEPDDVKTFN